VLPSAAPDAQLHLALSKAARAEPIVAESTPSQADSAGPAWRGDGPRACLGLFEAASALGYGHVLGAPIHFYLESITDESLAELGLVRASQHDGQVRVIEPTRPESVFRAMVLAESRHAPNVPCCDILQAWLDVSGHAVRGRQQAELIERAILPKLSHA
jgi:hypothetical protein